MIRRIPPDALERYIALGPNRSYRRLGQLLGISTRSIFARASKERWQAKLVEIEAKAREQALRRVEDDIASVHERQLRTVRALQGRALQALQAQPIESTDVAVRALVAALREERALIGESRPSLTSRVIAAADRAPREDLERRTIAIEPAAPAPAEGEGSAAAS